MRRHERSCDKCARARLGKGDAGCNSVAGGGYIPVATSFGLIANQAGFSSWEAIIISLVIYAGASQFLFVGMVASGAPLGAIVGQ